VWCAAAIEAFLLALVAVAPLGSLAFSVSPLARAWPWLLWPGRLLFGALPVSASFPPDRGWPALALFAVLLLGASGVQAVALLCVAGGWRSPSDIKSGSVAGESIGATGRDKSRPYTRYPQKVTAIWYRLSKYVEGSGGDASRERLALLVVVMGAALVFGVTLLLLPSLPSDDVFSYTLYGRISAVHHANPLVATPADFPNDPFLSLVFWRDVRSVYGPVWLLLSSGLSLLAQGLGGSPVAYVALFKALGLVAHLANALLIWAILGRLAPRRQLFGTLLYAWNPLCLLEFCASAHNDAVMLTFLLLGIYCFVRDWEWLALVAWGLAIATKYVPLILLPFYLVAIGYRLRSDGMRWGSIAVALGGRLALLAGIVALTAVPYWAGPRMLGALLFSPPAQQLDNSLWESISWPLRWLVAGGLRLPPSMARSLVDTTLKVGALFLFVVLWLRELRRASSTEGMLLAWGWALLWYVLVASGWFWPWYVTWAVVVAALAPVGRLTVATLLTAAGALSLYAFLPLHASPLYGFRSVVAFGPVLCYLLASMWQRRDKVLTDVRIKWGAIERRLARVVERTLAVRGS
jgi:alpha-1,6-mannosyltransferase